MGAIGRRRWGESVYTNESDIRARANECNTNIFTYNRHAECVFNGHGRIKHTCANPNTCLA